MAKVNTITKKFTVEADEHGNVTASLTSDRMTAVYKFDVDIDAFQQVRAEENDYSWNVREKGLKSVREQMDTVSFPYDMRDEVCHLVCVGLRMWLKKPTPTPAPSEEQADEA